MDGFDELAINLWRQVREGRDSSFIAAALRRQDAESYAKGLADAREAAEAIQESYKNSHGVYRPNAVPLVLAAIDRLRAAGEGGIRP
jgi:hypothetical protein